MTKKHRTLEPLVVLDDLKTQELHEEMFPVRREVMIVRPEPRDAGHRHTATLEALCLLFSREEVDAIRRDEALLDRLSTPWNPKARDEKGLSKGLRRPGKAERRKRR